MEVTTDDAAGIDVELAKVLITAILSIVLYGRQAFPENCFRKVSIGDLDHPLAKHENLLRCGQHLSSKENPLHILSPDRHTLVYMRECDNRRLHGLLEDLDQIFAALADRLVGKIYICFTDSKKWSRDSLLECYTLKFSYTELGDFHIYIDWAGVDDAPLKDKVSPDVFKSLKQVVAGCPQLPDPFYTRLFVSSVDSKTRLEGAWAGDGHGVREALLHFKSRKGSNSGRVGRFSCTAPSQEADRGDSDADGRLLHEDFPRLKTPELPPLCSSTVATSASPEPNLAASPARPTSESIISKEQRAPHDNFTSRLDRQHPTDTTSQSGTKSSAHERHAALDSTEDDGHDGDVLAQARPSSSGSTLVEQSIRGNCKKRSAPRDWFVPATQNAGVEAAIAPKYPRLAMIEEVPEDLPPTQRLETPSQSRQTQVSANVNPSFSFLDFD